jgi:hypothetical protein
MLLGAACLGASWHLGAFGIAISPAIVEFWRRAGSRIEAGAIATIYYVFAVFGVVLAAPAYGDTGIAARVACAVLSAMLVGAVWALLWSRYDRTRWWWNGFRTALLLLSPLAPVYGAFALASPITAAGIWLPGFGWAGLAFFVLALSAPSEFARSAAAGLAVLAHLAPSASFASPRRGAVIALETRIHVVDDRTDFVGQAHTAFAAQRVVPSEVDVAVLPESMGGVWTDVMRARWAPLAERLRRENRALFVGATLPTYEQGRVSWENGVVVLGDEKERFVRQRIPVPLVMWRPWSEGSYRAHWLSDALVQLRGRRYAVLVCYEHYLPLPVLLSVAARPDVLIGIANLEGFASESVERGQRASLEAWARLFGLPSAYAVNR